MAHCIALHGLATGAKRLLRSKLACPPAQRWRRVSPMVPVEHRNTAELKDAEAACSQGCALTVSAHIVSGVRMSLLKLGQAGVLKRTSRAASRRAYHTIHSR